MAILLTFNIGSAVLLAIMASIFWFGVGSVRREVGRGIAVFCGAMSAHQWWQAFDLLF